MNDLEHLYSLTEDSEDDAKMWAFAISDVLWHHAKVPGEWDFGHSPVCAGTSDEWPDSEINDMLISGQATIEDLIDLGNKVVAKGWGSNNGSE